MAKEDKKLRVGAPHRCRVVEARVVFSRRQAQADDRAGLVLRLREFMGVRDRVAVKDKSKVKTPPAAWAPAPEPPQEESAVHRGVVLT